MNHGHQQGVIRRAVDKVIETLDGVYFGHKHIAPQLVAKHTPLGVKLHLERFRTPRDAVSSARFAAEHSDELAGFISQHGPLTGHTPSAGATSYLKRIGNEHESPGGASPIHIRVESSNPNLWDKFFYSLGRLLHSGYPAPGKWNSITISTPDAPEQPRLNARGCMSLALQSSTVAAGIISSVKFFSHLEKSGLSFETLRSGAGLIAVMALSGVTILAARMARKIFAESVAKESRQNPLT